jgi:putative thioredoxin
MLIGLKPQTQSANLGASSANSMDVTSQNFEKEVIQASLKTPILIDFWAPWCGPCKQLVPLLEKIVEAQKGAIRLAKINVDENQELAAAFRVQSIPMVVAFFQGQPVTAFAGLKSQQELEMLVSQLVKLAQQNQPQANMPSSIDDLLAQAVLFQREKNFAEASQIYTLIFEQAPDTASSRPDILVSYLRCLISDQNYANVEQVLGTLKDEQKKDREMVSVQAFLQEMKSIPALDLDDLLHQQQKDPDNKDILLSLAACYFRHQRQDEAVDTLLALFKKDRQWNDECARKMLLRYFECWGSKDPATIEGRKRLSALLFS